MKFTGSTTKNGKKYTYTSENGKEFIEGKPAKTFLKQLEKQDAKKPAIKQNFQPSITHPDP